MPEGHTLHRLARLHRRRYVGAPVAVTSPQGRFHASTVDGRVLLRAEAHGKHLFHVYGPDATVHVHLGLYGTFSEYPHPVVEPVGQVRMRLVGPTHWTDLRGPTRCEVLTDVEVAALRARLGPDPLRRDARPDLAFARIAKSRKSIGVLLMDQDVIAGVGNVYRAEVLFRHGLHPLTPGNKVDRALWDLMWADLVVLMRHGVKVGRIDTVRPEHLPAATGRAPREDRHGGEVYVYRRTGMPCLVCGTPVAMADLAARNLYWCPGCQPE
ncbi:DNA-formamidopyrimidine glycosylase family protein [Actinosynnema sp. NPDC047251]|uniref:Endonuclease 8 1 n=1 Tax=Saccharothrix espanaensis (strain ATCC 51144 / DSM 44229 / JCM 9112 / NBRC 15066 / NRRL 15764) TaxID=1179773 RepID=K0JS69_SACES|nr:DNA-formamidopyrimidine glycosylase family protein [Saccharothrix espanaensis]CCH28676.1 putative DNA glycosylase [Saccharothrix espanaensis DSM 44229]